MLLKLVSEMRRRGSGHIVNVSSVGVRTPPGPRWGAYQASKGAFDMWLRSVAPELHADGVDVTSIYFGLVSTRMMEPTKSLRNAPGLSAEQAADRCEGDHRSHPHDRPLVVVAGRSRHRCAACAGRAGDAGVVAAARQTLGLSTPVAGDTVSLIDIAARLPALMLDAPVVARGTVRAFLVRGSAKRSIGRAFQNRAARCPDHVFIRFDDEALTYRQANETVNRYAATLAERGVGRGDVVGVIMRNSARTLLVMLAAVKLGAIAGMLNHKQRGNVLAHSVGLLHPKVIVGEEDLLSAVDESEAEVADTMTIDELERLSADAPTDNLAVTSSVRAKDPAFYIFTSGTTGAPKASVMTHYRWLRAMGGSGAIGMRLKSSDTVYCCLPLYHNTALTVAVSGVIGAGATLALGRSFSASRFWDDVTRYDATAFVYIGEVCRYLLNQPERDTDRTNKVRVIGGNGLRPDIWDEFTARFNISQVFELYGASEGNTGFVNIFHIPKTSGLCPTAVAFVEYDPETGEPVRDENGRVRKVRRGQPGLLLSKITKAQPFEGYTDPEAGRRS